MNTGYSYWFDAYSDELDKIVRIDATPADRKAKVANVRVTVDGKERTPGMTGRLYGFERIIGNYTPMVENDKAVLDQAEATVVNMLQLQGFQFGPPYCVFVSEQETTGSEVGCDWSATFRIDWVKNGAKQFKQVCCAGKSKSVNEGQDKIHSLTREAEQQGEKALGPYILP